MSKTDPIALTHVEIMKYAFNHADLDGALDLLDHGGTIEDILAVALGIIDEPVRFQVTSL